MGRAVGLHIARALALFAVTVQVFLPGALAVAESRGFDVAKFLCAPRVNVSDEAKAAVQDLLDLIKSEKGGDETVSETQCSHCTLSHMAVVHLIGSPLEPIGTVDDEQAPSLHVITPYLSRGPPLGSRAPPSFI